MGDSGEVLDIKIADLKATAPRFDHESVALAHALTKLRNGLTAAGAPWGDDDQGGEFHKAYGPRVEQIEHATQILVTGLAGIHEAMADMADGHVDNEELVHSMFSRIQIPHGAKSDGR
ncbi:hypothetical protein [Streptomyces sp. LaBMicrA B280]|uniref:hypothetical protein n=1 Tax=Streptomyces sp. LaBMicrA B280 TaxID=3391001 RepID=UPI003BA7BECA